MAIGLPCRVVSRLGVEAPDGSSSEGESGGRRSLCSKGFVALPFSIEAGDQFRSSDPTESTSSFMYGVEGGLNDLRSASDSRARLEVSEFCRLRSAIPSLRLRRRQRSYNLSSPEIAERVGSDSLLLCCSFGAKPIRDDRIEATK